jgi:hypothetical protein
MYINPHPFVRTGQDRGAIVIGRFMLQLHEAECLEDTFQTMNVVHLHVLCSLLCPLNKDVCTIW